MKKLVLTLIPPLFMTASSCHKHDDHNHDDHNHSHSNTEIQILSPANNSSFSATDSVPINAVLTNASGVHHYQLNVTNPATGEVAFSAAGHSHSTRVEFSDYYKPSIASTGNLLLNVLAFDHTGNVSSSKVHNFSVAEVANARPQINLTSPAVTRFYNNGDTMFISGIVSHNQPLQQFRAYITKNTITDFDFNIDTLTQNSYNFSLIYPIRVVDHADFVLRVEATDQAGNLSQIQRSYHVHP
jgi:hypothetical protein